MHTKHIKDDEIDKCIICKNKVKVYFDLIDFDKSLRVEECSTCNSVLSYEIDVDNKNNK